MSAPNISPDTVEHGPFWRVGRLAGLSGAGPASRVGMWVELAVAAVPGRSESRWGAARSAGPPEHLRRHLGQPRRQTGLRRPPAAGVRSSDHGEPLVLQSSAARDCHTRVPLRHARRGDTWRWPEQHRDGDIWRPRRLPAPGDDPKVTAGRLLATPGGMWRVTTHWKLPGGSR